MDDREFSAPETDRGPDDTDRRDADDASGWMGRLSRIGRNLAIIAGIFTALSTMGGLTWNLIEDAQATREKRFAARISQLTSFADFGDAFKHYREIGPLGTAFAQRARQIRWNCDSLLNLYGSGAAIYYSDDLKAYAHVREFYEDLGLLIRYQAIDFDLVYESIIFPDDFVEATAPLTRCIGENWFGKGRGVKDFSENMIMLGENYDRRRKGEATAWDSSD